MAKRRDHQRTVKRAFERPWHPQKRRRRCFEIAPAEGRHSCLLEEAYSSGKSPCCGQLVKRRSACAWLYRDRQICQRLPCRRCAHRHAAISAPLFRCGGLPLFTRDERWQAGQDQPAPARYRQDFGAGALCPYDNGIGLLNENRNHSGENGRARRHRYSKLVSSAGCIGKDTHLILRLTADSFPRLLSISNSTACPSLRELNPARSTAEICTNTSFPPPPEG